MAGPVLAGVGFSLDKVHGMKEVNKRTKALCPRHMGLVPGRAIAFEKPSRPPANSQELSLLADSGRPQASLLIARVVVVTEGAGGPRGAIRPVPRPARPHSAGSSGQITVRLLRPALLLWVLCSHGRLGCPEPGVPSGTQWELCQESGPALLPQGFLSLPCGSSSHPAAARTPGAAAPAALLPCTPPSYEAVLRLGPLRWCPQQLLPGSCPACQDQPRGRLLLPGQWVLWGPRQGAPATLHHSIPSPGGSKEFVTKGAAVGLAGKRMGA